MNIKTLVASIGAIAVLALGACSTSQTPTTVDTPASAVPTTTSTAPQTTPPTSPAPAPVEPAALPAPITFECGDFSLYQSGTALYSDGTTGYEASCDTYQAPVEKVLWYCDYPETAVYTDGTSSGTDPACIHDDEPVNPGGGYPYIASEDRNGDGVVNGYERCGLACGEEPTSGDIQTEHGCEEGYITGELCNRYN